VTVITFQVQSNLPQALSTPNITVSLSDISNQHVANDARWRVSAFVDHRVDDRTWAFRLIGEVHDDGAINEISYVIVFFP
jgi:hypothetical protein